MVDTNVLISAVVGHGRPRRLVTILLERHQVVSSRQMLAEFVEVISRREFVQVGRSRVRSFLSIFIRQAEIVPVKQTTRVIAQDPDDDVVLGTAVEGNASLIVSGDRHLLDLKRFRGIRILTVEESLELLGQHSGAN